MFHNGVMCNRRYYNNKGETLLGHNNKGETSLGHNTKGETWLGHKKERKKIWLFFAFDVRFGGGGHCAMWCETTLSIQNSILFSNLCMYVCMYVYVCMEWNDFCLKNFFGFFVFVILVGARGRRPL
jgi:hypothetical protein